MPRRNLVQERARAMVRRAIARGTLIRPAACERCGAVPKCVLAHHIAYSQPLNVAWLCPSCHRLAHPRPPHAPKPDSARARVERELRRDPARSDALIAIAANCTPPAAGRWRHGLEQSGQIPAISPGDRTAIPRSWTPRAPRLAIEQGATTPAEIMAMARVSYGTAWRALSRAQRARFKRPRSVEPADAAAATDAFTVIRILSARPSSADRVRA